jgi:hypothetical protein
VAGINIAFLADVTSFLRGVKSTEDALDDVSESLDDMARDAQDAGRDAGKALETGVERGAQDAGEAVGDLEKSFRNMAADASKYSRQAGDDLGDNIRRGTRDAEGGLDDFKQEAGSTARETAASFSGSADDIAGSFQEVAANALAGFGPIGAGAGLALAAGLGTFWADFQADAERAKQATSDAFDDMIESGSRFLSAELVNQRIRDIVTNADDAATSYEHVAEVAEATGADVALVLRAFAGDQEAVNAVIDATAVKSQAIKDKYGPDGLLSDAARADRAELAQVITDLEGVQKTTDEAARKADEYGRAARSVGTQARDGAAEAMAAYDGLGRKLDQEPLNIRVGVDMSDAEAKVREFLNRPRRAVIGVSGTPGAPQAV